MGGDIDDLAGQVERASQAQLDLQAELDAATQRVERAEAARRQAADQARQQADAAQQQLAALQAQHAQELAAARRQAAEAARREMNDDIDQLAGQVERAHQQARQQTVQQVHDAEQALRAEYAAELSALQAELDEAHQWHERELDAARQQYQELLDEAQQRYEQEVAMLRQALDKSYGREDEYVALLDHDRQGSPMTPDSLNAMPAAPYRADFGGPRGRAYQYAPVFDDVSDDGHLSPGEIPFRYETGAAMPRGEFRFGTPESPLFRDLPSAVGRQRGFRPVGGEDEFELGYRAGRFAAIREAANARPRQRREARDIGVGATSQLRSASAPVGGRRDAAQLRSASTPPQTGNRAVRSAPATPVAAPKETQEQLLLQLRKVEQEYMGIDAQAERDARKAERDARKNKRIATQEGREDYRAQSKENPYSDYGIAGGGLLVLAAIITPIGAAVFFAALLGIVSTTIMANADHNNRTRNSNRITPEARDEIKDIQETLHDQKEAIKEKSAIRKAELQQRAEELAAKLEPNAVGAPEPLLAAATSSRVPLGHGLPRQLPGMAVGAARTV